MRVEALDSPRAWLTVAAGFLACFTLFSVAYSFGAFFKPVAGEFGASREATSALFSITAFVYFGLGPVTGHIADRFGPRPVIVAAAVAMGTGLALTSMIHRLWLGYLTYSVVVGFGIACGYVPSLAMVSGWFSRRRNTALGVAVSGIGCGTLAGAPIAATIIERAGWREAYVILGIGSTLLMLVCAALARRPPVAHPHERAHRGGTIFTPDFALLYGTWTLGSIAMFVPFVYLTPFAREHGSGEVAAAALVGMIGAGSIGGRLILGALADRTDTIRVFKGCILVLAASYGLWLASDSYRALMVFALGIGACYGGAVALSPAVVAELFGTRELGFILGMLWTSCGAGTLVGLPLVGAIIDHTGSYRIGIGFTMSAAVIALMFLARMSNRGERAGITLDRGETKVG